ncbi:recombinase family protein [Streptomyces sp. NPDC051572]|uniref:recombinase family protein n=1 Tax=Streptomyces sp. NPDC051572 TaxID=3155802 RepID=UPI00344D4920
MPIAGYLRISDADLAEIRRAVRNGDITPEEAAERERKGVLKQRDDILALAARHGYGPGEIVWYEDNNLSAFSRTVKRKDFERLIKDLPKGHLDGILFYDIDRYTRQPRDLERTIDVYETTSRPLIFDGLSGQNFDLSTSDGRFSARLFVSIANKASEDTRRRIKRETNRMAQAGEFHGGTPAYGWDTKDRLKIDPQAADVIRRSTKWFIRGDRIPTILDRLAEEGLVNPSTGRPFSREHFRRILMRARNAGIRIYQSEPITDADGKYVMGDWPAIVTVGQWEAVMATIAGRQKKTKPDTTTKYLLSGIARCARCGYRMHGAPVWQKSKDGGPSKKTDRYAYTCLKRHADQCGRMQIVGMPVDEMVRNLVWDVIERSLAGQEVKQETTWLRQLELDEVEAEIKALKAKWDAREIRASIYVSTLEALETDRDSLKADRALFMTAAIPASRDDVIKKGWAGLSLERQREVVRSVLSAVLVHSAKSRGANFDAARVEPVFK